MAPRLCALPFSCAVGLLAIIIHLSPGEWISLGLYMFRGRDSMSKVGGLGVHEMGGYYFHSEYIWHRVLVFFMTTSNFGGAQPPLIKKWGGSSPPCPPRFSVPDVSRNTLTTTSLSRKFWSAENFGPRTKIFGKIGPGGQYFSEKIGPYPKILVRPYLRGVRRPRGTLTLYTPGISTCRSPVLRCPWPCSVPLRAAAQIALVELVFAGETQ